MPAEEEAKCARHGALCKPGPCDIFWCGFSCKPFSKANKNAKDNKLLLAAIDPTGPEDEDPLDTSRHLCAQSFECTISIPNVIE